MDNVTPFKVLIPANLARWLGYRGKRQFTAFHWTPSGDELTITDGTLTTVGQGNNHNWLRFMRNGDVLVWRTAHPDVNFGASDADATHWLVVWTDTDHSHAFVAPAHVGREIVLNQALPPKEA